MPVCRAFLVVAAACLAVLGLPTSSGRAALSCGLPDARTTWIDFADGSTSFWRDRFARPGVVIATGGTDLAAEARQSGAATVHWDMYLRKRVGTPSDPADPALIEKRADGLFDYAVSVTGCQTPLIALNELWGASLPTPLTPTAERYRANVLRVREPARRARRSAGPPRLERAVHGRRRRSLVEVDRRRVGSRARELRERERHLARRARSRGPDACALATASRRRGSSRSTSPRPVSGSSSASRRARAAAGERGSSRVRAGSTSSSGRRSRFARWRASSDWRTSGRGAGRSATRARTTRTRPTLRASGSGLATRACATRPRCSERSSTPTSSGAS